MLGADTEKHSADSVWPAAASKAKAMAVLIKHIMAKAGWSREVTFAKYYNKEIVPVHDTFQDAVLHYMTRPSTTVNNGMVAFTEKTKQVKCIYSKHHLSQTQGLGFMLVAPSPYLHSLLTPLPHSNCSKSQHIFAKNCIF
ncbi:hypothetical protein E2C01_053248 [Portunus trituberculatus]|uniref:Uncharacterized protein n=1 Tax=Portunus trituberculatus TaxID=210409 RepID=A0A5B7GJS9_PORTR|nr:hypothetical protein [Portunus trituberculatus]